MFSVEVPSPSDFFSAMFELIVNFLKIQYYKKCTTYEHHVYLNQNMVVKISSVAHMRILHQVGV